MQWQVIGVYDGLDIPLILALKNGQKLTDSFHWFSALVRVIILHGFFAWQTGQNRIG